MISVQKGSGAAHVLPFVGWIAMMFLPGAPSAGSYAARVAVGAALFLALRPWHGYAPCRLRNVPAALAVGALVFLIWILPETRWLEGWPNLQALYLKYAVLPWGRAPEPVARSPYAPEVCGWPLTLVRWAGSALVISFIEEFFWRGFVYRAVIARDFRSVDLGRFVPGAFVVTALLFGLEHDRWLVGIVAGCAYGIFVVRTRDVWAAGIAHAVTNGLLGAYVLRTGDWAFW